MRTIPVAIAILVASACKGPPTRIVASNSNTVVVNNQRPVQIPIQVIDAAGHILPDTGVRYRWTAGVPVTMTATGVVTCTQSGDATVRASLGPLATRLLLRCRPVSDVRATPLMNLVVGDPAQALPFEAVGMDDRPVTLLAGRVTVDDSAIVAIEGLRIRARAPGSTGLTMRVGDREAFMGVHVYQRAQTPEGIQPGQHVAIPVRLSGGETRRWRLSAAPELYYLSMLPDRDEQQMPRLTIVGANCSPALDAKSFWCIALHSASVIVYHPRQVDPAIELTGTLVVWRQASP